MERPRRMIRLFSRLGEAAWRLLRREPRPAMIGTPPSARPMWHDPTAHARDFSQRYAQDLDLIVAQRIQDLGIADRQNGRPDPDAGGRWRAFFPDQVDGGGVVGDQINADAGLFDTGLMGRRYGPEVGEKWAKDRLLDRLDQVIAHEYTEAAGISHQEAVQRAAETPLAIRTTARERLRAMAEAEKRGQGRWNS